MKKKQILIMAIILLFIYTLSSQVGINLDGSDPEVSAILDVKSTNKGLLPPRITNTNAITNPVAGLLVFDENTNCMRYYNGSVWSECMGRTFVCGDALIDPRDGQSYSTVQIGSQCWMAENINIGTKINGNEEQTDNASIEKYCYGNNTTECDTYGGFYQWNEMMQFVTVESTQGVCPTGWHIPSDNEWKTLEIELGMSQSEADNSGSRGTNEGSKMAGNADLWYNGALENDPEFNTSGLMLLPAGYRNTDGSFDDQNSHTILWTSGVYSTYAWRRNLSYEDTDVYRSYYNKAYGFSVRCVKD